MPELPDVEAVRRFLEAAALRRPIVRVELLAPEMLGGATPGALRRSLAGRALEATHRHGKWLFARAAGGPWLVLHLGMTGDLRQLGPAEDLPVHARLLLAFGDGWRLVLVDQRKLGRIDLAADPAAFAASRGLGPDALGLPAPAFEAALAGRRGAVKTALLDQRVVAGIGSIYADEVCFQAGIHPAARLDRLDRTARLRLARAAGRVLRAAVERGARAERFPRGWLIPWREAGAPCPRSDGVVQRIRVGGRSTYLCPACQGGAR